MHINFKTASDRVTHCVTLAHIAKATGMAEVTIRQARLDPESKSYRSPPTNWPDAIAKLARERAAELVELAEELEG